MNAEGRSPDATENAGTRSARPPASPSDTFLTGRPADFELPSAPPGFELLGVLGRGGMAVVYHARQLRLNREVALKFVLDGEHASTERRFRLLAEAEAVAALNHPGIVQVYECGAHLGRPYLVMELCPGGTLAAQLDGRPRPPRAAADLVVRLARAVQSAHVKGIVHRDLKPGNILIAADGSPKVADFGLVKRVDGGGLTATGDILGTPKYMAPEQAGGAVKDIGPPADVYALGAILYEQLTGRPPHQGDNAAEVLLHVLHDDPVPPSRLVRGLPRDLTTVCQHCLERSPARRYPTAGRLADDLQAFLDGRPVAARRTTEIERVWKWAKRRPVVAALIAAVALSLLGGSAVSAFFAVQANERAREAEIAAGQARRSAARAEESAVRMFRDRGFLSYQQGDAADGLLWHAHALSRLPADRRADRDELLRHAGVWAYHTAPLVRAFAHPGKVYAAALSPDGRLAAVGGEGKFLQVYEAESGKPVGDTLPHAGTVRSAAFTPDGKRLVTASDDGFARVWDAETGQPLCEPLPTKVPAFAVAVTPDGTAFAAGGAVALFRFGLTDYKPLGDPVKVGRRVERIAFARDGRRVVVAADAAALVVRDWPECRPLGKPLDHGSVVTAVAFSPDGTRLASGTWQRSVEYWSLATGTAVRRPQVFDGFVSAVAFAPEGDAIYYGFFDGTVRAFDEPTGRPLGVPLRHLGPVQALSLDGSGRLALTASEDGYARLWRLRRYAGGELAVAPATLTNGPPVVANAAAAGGGRLLVAARGEARLIDAQGRPVGQPIRTAAAFAALAPDGRTALLSDAAGRFQFWDAEAGTPRGAGGSLPDPQVFARFRGDSRKALLWGWGTRLTVLDAETGAVERTIEHKPHEDGNRGVLSADFSDDGTAVFSTGSDRGVYRWNLATGERVFRRPIGNWGYSLAVGSGVVAVGGAANEVNLTDAATGTPVGAPLPHPGLIWSLAFSPDRRRLLTGCYDGSARLWDVESGRAVGRPWKGGTTLIHQLDFRADGRLALSSDEFNVTLWDPATGRRFGPPLPQSGRATLAQFVHPGDALATAGGGLARLYPIPPPLPDDPARLRLWVAVHFGLEVTDDDEAVVLSPAEWGERYERLKAEG